MLHTRDAVKVTHFTELVGHHVSDFPRLVLGGAVESRHYQRFHIALFQQTSYGSTHFHSKQPNRILGREKKVRFMFRWLCGTVCKPVRHLLSCGRVGLDLIWCSLAPWSLQTPAKNKVKHMQCRSIVSTHRKPHPMGGVSLWSQDMLHIRNHTPWVGPLYPSSKRLTPSLEAAALLTMGVSSEQSDL